MLIDRRSALLSTLALPTLSTGAWAEADKVRLGQATTALSFVKIFAARTLDTFSAQNIALEWVAIPGGDPPALAAIDSGDLDLAAVGSDTVLSAIAKGAPFKIIYSLMSKLSFELTVSNAFLKKIGVTKDSPLDARIGVLKTAVVGVSAVGGAQDRVARWLARKGGLDPKAVKIALVGAPPALGAALENGRIDAFMLSPPESVIAEARGYGTVLVSPNKEIPGIKGIPSLVLAAHAAPKPEARARIVRTVRALNTAATAILADPAAVSDRIQAKFFPKVPPAIIRTAIGKLQDGLGDNGRLDQASAELLIRYSTDSGGGAPKGNDFWTNAYVEAALKG